MAEERDDMEKESIEMVSEVPPGFIPDDVEVRRENIYVIPLWRSWISGRGYRRANKAVRYLKRFIARHMRNPNIKISPDVNKLIWHRGIRNPPRKIKVRAVLGSDDVVYVLPVEDRE